MERMHVGPLTPRVGLQQDPMSIKLLTPLPTVLISCDPNSPGCPTRCGRTAFAFHPQHHQEIHTGPFHGCTRKLGTGVYFLHGKSPTCGLLLSLLPSTTHLELEEFSFLRGNSY